MTWICKSTIILNPGVSFGLGSTGYSLPNKLTLSQLETFRSRCTLSRGNKKKQESRCSHKHWQALFHSRASLTHLFKVASEMKITLLQWRFLFIQIRTVWDLRGVEHTAFVYHCMNLNRNLQEMHMYGLFIYFFTEWMKYKDLEITSWVFSKGAYVLACRAELFFSSSVLLSLNLSYMWREY